MTTTRCCACMAPVESGPFCSDECREALRHQDDYTDTEPTTDPPDRKEAP